MNQSPGTDELMSGGDMACDHVRSVTPGNSVIGGGSLCGDVKSWIADDVLVATGRTARKGKMSGPFPWLSSSIANEYALTICSPYSELLSRPQATPSLLSSSLNGRTGNRGPWQACRDHRKKKRESSAIKLASEKKMGIYLSPSSSSCTSVEDNKRKFSPGVQYHVAIKTSSSSAQDVVACVWLSMTGTCGRLRNVYLTLGRIAVVKGGSVTARNAWCFRRGTIEVFTISDFDIGKIIKISLQHKVVEGGDWSIDEVRVVHSGIGTTYKFNVRSQDTDEQMRDKLMRHSWDKSSRGSSLESQTKDKDSQTDIVPQAKDVIYEIRVHTGNVRGGGTTANVFMTLTGDKCTTPHLKLRNELTGNFIRGSTSLFKMKSMSLGNLQKIRIEHDDSGTSPSWFLDHVSVREVRDKNNDSLMYFPCGMWFDSTVGDKRVVRSIAAVRQLPFKETSGFQSYVVTTVTGTERGAGTTAVVYATLHGSIATSRECILDSSRQNFSPGRKDSFTVTVMRDLGEILAVQIRHDNSGSSPNWSLKKLSVLDVCRMLSYEFPCQSWLSNKLPGCSSSITLTQYKKSLRNVETQTPLPHTFPAEHDTTTNTHSHHKVLDVPINAVREERSTNMQQTFSPRPPTAKRRQKQQRGKFSILNRETIRKQESKSSVTDRKSTETITSTPRQMIPTEHQESGMVLDESMREEEEDSQKSNFETKECEVVLESGNKADAPRKSSSSSTASTISEALQSSDAQDDNNQSLDNLAVSTGDIATLDSHVNISNKDAAEDVTVDRDNHVITSKDHAASSDDQVSDMTTQEEQREQEKDQQQQQKQQQQQQYQQRQEQDKQEQVGPEQDKQEQVGQKQEQVGQEQGEQEHRTEVGEQHFYAYSNQTVADHLTNHSKTDLGDISLDEPQTKQEATNGDHNVLSTDKSGHLLIDRDSNNALDNSGDSKYIDSVSAREPYDDVSSHVTQASDNVDSQSSDYAQSVDEITGKAADAVRSSKSERLSSMEPIKEETSPSTEASVNKDVDVKQDTSSTQSFNENEDALSSSSSDIELKALAEEDEHEGTQSLSELAEEAMGDGINHEDDGPQHYEVTVYTTDIVHGGTSANVFADLYGSNKVNTGPLPLSKPNSNCFSRGSVDAFVVETPFLGSFIDKVRISHDNSGFTSAWHVDKVELCRVVTEKTADGVDQWRSVDKIVTYPCNQWLSRSNDDGEIVRELVPMITANEHKAVTRQDTLSLKNYNVYVFTGNVMFAGTNANIYVTIYGSKGDTGERQLRSSETHKDKFERDHVDVFNLSAADLGKISRLKVRRDKGLLGSDYYLEKVEVVDVLDGRNTVFMCQQWLSDEQSNGGLLEREFMALEPEKLKTRSTGRVPSRQGTNYKITVKTGDIRYAGTSANIFLTLFGEDNSSDELHLQQSLTSDNTFERNQIDIFVFDIPFNLGPLNLIKIWHDNKGFGSSWFLESVQVCDESTGNVYDFPCHGWLARDKGDGKTLRELTCSTVRSEWESTSGKETDVMLPDKSKSQRLKERWIWSMFQMASQGNKGFVTEPEMIKLCRKLNIAVPTNTIKDRFKEVAGNGGKSTCSQVDYQQFKKCFKGLVGRPEVLLLFNRYSSNRQWLTADELLLFLSTEQEVASPSIEFCEGVIKHYGETTDDRHAKMLTLEAFTQYLLSAENGIFNTIHTAVYQDMTQPLTHYYIASSHNTYLMEHQLKGKSSEEGYARALRKGCRCVEIDCWDGEDGEPDVYHGYTLTSRISLKSVLETIHRHAFDVSDFPVILSFENHCSEKGHKKIAAYLQETFGEMLYVMPVDKTKGCLPSPDDLKGKIIIKHKKLEESEEQDNTMEEETEEILSDSDEFSDGDTDIVPPHTQLRHSCSQSRMERSSSMRRASSPGGRSMTSSFSDVKKANKVKHKIAVELSRLVNIVEAVKYHSLSRGNFWQMSSLGEAKLFKLINSCPQQLVEYNRHQMMRVYPAGRRVDSSNYNPIDPWLCGCSMVALNYQFPGKMMDINQGLFQQNGFSGYILKPTVLRGGEHEFNPFSDDPVPHSEPKLLIIKIISGQQLPKPGGSSTDKEVDPSVVVETIGLVCDRSEERTRVIPGNGFNPLWEEKFVFPVHFPDMALIRLLVISGSGKATNNVIGQYTLPFNSIQPGYRHVPLLSVAGHILPNATLFVHVTIGGGLVVKKESFSRGSLSKSASMRSRTSVFSTGSKKQSREYVKLKKIGIARLDGLFQAAEYLLVKCTDLQEDADLALNEFQVKTGSSQCNGFAEAACHFVESYSQYGFTIETQDKTPILRSLESSLPFDAATLKVLFQRVVAEAKALVAHGHQLADEIMRVHETGSKLTITVELKQSGLKDKGLSKALESFAWNMQMLKDTADIIKSATNRWMSELDKLNNTSANQINEKVTL